MIPVIAQTTTGSPLGGIIGLIFAILVIASWWTVFAKAGRPGWFAVIPILNFITLLGLAGKPIWWVILFFIPLVNIVALWLVLQDLAKNFGKDFLFTLGLFFFNPLFMFILAFDGSDYQGPPA